MALPAAEVGVFLRALTGRVMGISGNNSVGSVQTRSESKQRRPGGRRKHLTPHRQWVRRCGGERPAKTATFVCVMLL